MQGRSIMPLVNRQRVEWPGEVFVQISESQVGRAVRTRRWKYSVVAKDKVGWQDKDSDHYTEEILYDLLADPYELTNLIGHRSHRGVADVLRRRLIRCMVAAGEAEPHIELAPDIAGNPQRRVSPEEMDS
jgi:arylsulfatase A-like enzyme